MALQYQPQIPKIPSLGTCRDAKYQIPERLNRRDGRCQICCCPKQGFWEVHYTALLLLCVNILHCITLCFSTLLVCFSHFPDKVICRQVKNSSHLVKLVHYTVMRSGYCCYSTLCNKVRWQYILNSTTKSTSKVWNLFNQNVPKINFHLVNEQCGFIPKAVLPFFLPIVLLVLPVYLV